MTTGIMILSLQRYPYYDTISIKGLILQRIMILSSSPIMQYFLMNLVDFVKLDYLKRYLTLLPHPSNINFATILTNMFSKQKYFLFSYFVNSDKIKSLQTLHHAPPNPTAITSSKRYNSVRNKIKGKVH